MARINTGMLGMVAFFALAACSKEEPAKPRVAPPSAPSADAVAVAKQPGAVVTPGAKAPATEPSAAGANYKVAETGNASFLIDAPLEKIKGEATGLRGSLQVDPSKLSATRGQVDVDLGTLKTKTFEDAGKNSKQTEHAHNWFQLGTDVEAKQRAENQWARFTIRSVKPSGSDDLAQVKENAGSRSVDVSADGDLWIHGVSSSKSVRLTLTFSGPATAPTEISVKTAEPLLVSLKEHDVKPRDVAGKFVQGALEQIGQKIDDKVQVSFAFVAKPATP